MGGGRTERMADDSTPPRGSEPTMDEPLPAEDWPDAPLTGEEAHHLLSEEVDAVWVRPPDEAARETLLTDDDPENSIVEIVLETPDEYHLYQYAHHMNATAWMDYGTESKDLEVGPMAERLDEFYLLAGDDGAES